MTLIASNNQHKIKEFHRIFQNELNNLHELHSSIRETAFMYRSDIREYREQCIFPLCTAREFFSNFAPIENGNSFLENSMIKANDLFTRIESTPKYSSTLGTNNQLPHFIIAEDSGIAVDALGGEPGIYSARFGQKEFNRSMSSQEQNNLLLSKLNNLPQNTNRTCRYICCITLICLDQGALKKGLIEKRKTLTVTEYLEGEIAQKPSQAQGGFGYDPIFYLPERGCTVAEISEEEKNTISHRGKASRIIAQELFSGHLS